VQHKSYLASLSILLAELTTEPPSTRRAAELAASAAEAGRWVHVFGSGHSVMAAMEIFPRYRSFPIFHPLMDPRLMWHPVSGPGGAEELLWLQRQPGDIVCSPDVLIVVSHSGRNAAPVEAAQFAAQRGLKVVAVTSGANVQQHRAGRPEQSHIANWAEVVIDTKAPVADAISEVPGWGREPVGAASTVLMTAVMNALLVETAAVLGASGPLTARSSPLRWLGWDPSITRECLPPIVSAGGRPGALPAPASRLGGLTPEHSRGDVSSGTRWSVPA
jgi:uncharacterized phosphosugar-binding protein